MPTSDRTFVALRNRIRAGGSSSRSACVTLNQKSELSSTVSVTGNACKTEPIAAGLRPVQNALRANDVSRYKNGTSTAEEDETSDSEPLPSWPC